MRAELATIDIEEVGNLLEPIMVEIFGPCEGHEAWERAWPGGYDAFVHCWNLAKSKPYAIETARADADSPDARDPNRWGARLIATRNTGYRRFLSFAHALAKQTDGEIFLPVDTIGRALSEHPHQIGRWRDRATADGFLDLVATNTSRKAKRYRWAKVLATPNCEGGREGVSPVLGREGKVLGGTEKERKEVNQKETRVQEASTGTSATTTSGLVDSFAFWEPLHSEFSDILDPEPPTATLTTWSRYGKTITDREGESFDLGEFVGDVLHRIAPNPPENVLGYVTASLKNRAQNGPSKVRRSRRYPMAVDPDSDLYRQCEARQKEIEAEAAARCAGRPYPAAAHPDSSTAVQMREMGDEMRKDRDFRKAIWEAQKAGIPLTPEQLAYGKPAEPIISAEDAAENAIIAKLVAEMEAREAREAAEKDAEVDALFGPCADEPGWKP